MLKELEHEARRDRSSKNPLSRPLLTYHPSIPPHSAAPALQPACMLCGKLLPSGRLNPKTYGERLPARERLPSEEARMWSGMVNPG